MSLNRLKRKIEYSLHQHCISSLKTRTDSYTQSQRQCTLSKPRTSKQSQANNNLFPITPDQVAIAQQPQFTPDTQRYSNNMKNNSCIHEANHDPPLPSMPSHTPHYTHHDQGNMTDFGRFLARWEPGADHHRLNPVQRPTV